MPDQRSKTKPVFHDAVLGELTPYSKGDWWEAAVKIGDRGVEFQLGGESEPDPANVAHAHEIVRDFAAFLRKVDDFLAAEAARFPGAAHEIGELTLQTVCLLLPPGAKGMLYFLGPDPGRLWRCDYNHRQPKGLIFDM